MKTLLTANISTKTVTEGDNTWEPPEFVFDESFTIALRLQQSINGQLVEWDEDVDKLRAMIGLVDARPDAGDFALQIGPGPQTAANTTAALTNDCTAAAMQAAINAKPSVVLVYGMAKVSKRGGSWQIQFGAGPQTVPMKVVNNTLFPVSFGRVSSFAIDGAWVQKVRLIQATVAVTETDERILPPAPTVERTIAGGTTDGHSWNEVQALYVPPDFRATFVLKSGAIARTGELSREDSAETIQSLLEEVLGAGNVKVSNSAPFTARIEYIGALAGATQPVLEVIPVNVPPGDLTFTVALDKEELATLLMVQERVILPLEVRIFPVVGKPFVAFRQSVTIVRPVQWPEMALVPNIDWLRVPSPKDYQPVSPDTVLTGQQYYPVVRGNGVATVFVVDHPLATDIVKVWVIENTSNGRQLVDGTDFAVRIVDANSVEVTALTGAPALNAWRIIVMSAQTVAAFAAGLNIEIAQVNGLQAILDAINAAIAELQTYVPTNPPALPATSGDAFNVELPDVREVYPIRFTAGASFETAAQLSALKARPLLPAVHDASVIAVTLPLPPPESVEGAVLFNDTDSDIEIPGGGGRPPRIIKPDEFIASDGRFLYGATRDAATTSYYPTDFERRLAFLTINAKQFLPGKIFAFDFQLLLQLLAANTSAQYVLKIDVGALPSQSTPATTGVNLQDVVWNPTPVLSERILFGSVSNKQTFGCEFVRAADGLTITGNKILFGVKQATAVVPASAEFALRARLDQFDLENSAPDPRGLVSLSVTNARVKIS